MKGDSRNMDFMLEEELIDLMTFCLQNSDSAEVSDKHKRITEIGHELFADGLRLVMNYLLMVALMLWRISLSC